MAEKSIRHLALVMVATAGLLGCENASNPFTGRDKSAQEPVTSDAAQSVRLVGRDIESPETFQTTDTALWDGRPSLGGVWVASPDVVNPERVILRNETNGKFVIGALFRRERDNPGPKLQISSDAADALGMLAGQPGKLNVTALRREESKTETVPAAAVNAAEAPAATGQADPEVAAADPIAAAGAAIDRADGATPADGGETVAAAPALFDALDPSPQPGETKRAARKRARAAAKAAAAAEAEAPALEGDVEIVGDAALAAPVPALEVATLPDAPVADAPAYDGGSTRVQIGIYSIEANAQEAVDKLKSGGIGATVSKQEAKGKPYWSVVASGEGGSKALLAKVKDLGFTDAYVVSG